MAHSFPIQAGAFLQSERIRKDVRPAYNKPWQQKTR